MLLQGKCSCCNTVIAYGGLRSQPIPKLLTRRRLSVIEWSVLSMLYDRSTQRLLSSAVCQRLSHWPHPLPGTSTPSFKVSYNNSIHSIPLRNTCPLPLLRSLHPRPLPALPSSATLSISSNDSTLFFSFSSVLHFFPPSYRLLFTSERPRGGRPSDQMSRTMTVSCWSN